MSKRSGRSMAEVEAIFQSVVELPAGERHRALSEQCGADIELRTHLERLLANHEMGMGEFLEPSSSIFAQSAPDPATVGTRIEAPTFALGERVARRYQVIRLLGRGGMGEVYEVLDEDLGVTLALKTLPVHLARDPKALKRLKQEVLLARSITHGNVCRIYDLGRHEAADGAIVWFLTMEILRGESLGRILERHGPFSTTEALPLVEQIVAGLDAAHRARVTHLDLKSTNIMLVPHSDGMPRTGSPADRLVVTDFGLAKAAGKATDRDIEHAIAGTPAYMAPEQVRGEATGPATDIYALGVVLYEMVTGELPFTGWAAWKASLLQRHETPAPPRSKNPDLDDRWENVILRCLLPDPRERFGSVGHVLEALRHGARGSLEERSSQDATATMGPAHLPPEQATFVGRKAELAELSGLFSNGSRVVTILGAAGMGKTRLAVRFGWENLGKWPGGIWFAALSAAKSRNGILSAVAGSLGVQLWRANSVEQLGHAIAGRGHCLIICDNFEQIVEHAPETLGKWLEHTTNAQFLVTSRERLKVTGENVVTVQPLDMASGVQLFETRVQRHRAEYKARGTELTLAEEVVRMTDGMPLALELVAARTWAMTVGQIVKRMSDRLQALNREGEGGSGHLRAAIDGSWELLKPWEQSAWAQCSVFEGGFTLEAAEAVVEMKAWPEAPWVVDVLRSLVEKSLLRMSVPQADRRSAPEVRFGMYVSLQEYARKRLRERDAIASNGSGDEALRLAEERHGRWYAALGTRHAIDALYGHGGGERRWGLVPEMENLIVACRRAIVRQDEVTATHAHCAAWAVLELRGPFGVGIELGREIIQLPLGTKARARVLTTLGTAELQSGQLEEARSRFEEVLTIYRETNLMDDAGVIIGALGNLDLARGKLESAFSHYESALECHRKVKDRAQEGVILGNLGLVHRELGRTKEARECYEAAIVVNREVGNRRIEGLVLNSLGNLHREQGRVEEGHSTLEKALSIIREVGDRRNEAVVLGNLGNLYREQGKMIEARAMFDSALIIRRETGDRRAQGIAVGNVALVEHEEGRMHEARSFYETALSIHREVGNLFYEGLVLGNLGDLHYEQGQLQEAQSSYEAALAIHRRLENVLYEGTILGSLALIRLDQGRIAEAREGFETAEKLLRKIENASELGKLLCGRVEVEIKLGNNRQAWLIFHEAQELAKQIGANPHSELGRKLAKMSHILPQPEACS